jgi:hypothetical protein
MVHPKFTRCAALLAGLVLAPVSAWATQPASLILHRAVVNPWIVGIANQNGNPGKLKIFDKEPQYDEDGELQDTPSPVATLRNYGDTFTLSRSNGKYWFVFYPKWGLLNLTATLRPVNRPEASAATLDVKQVAIKGAGALKLEVKASDTQDVKLNPNVDNFENTAGGPLLVLN